MIVLVCKLATEAKERPKEEADGSRLGDDRFISERVYLGQLQDE